MPSGKRWTVQDRNGRPIYLTHERWQHIVEPERHLEMSEYEEELKETLRAGTRTQDSLDPTKFYYLKAFHGLPEGNNHIVAVVRFGFALEEGTTIPNNFIVTAYQTSIRSKR